MQCIESAAIYITIVYKPKNTVASTASSLLSLGFYYHMTFVYYRLICLFKCNQSIIS
ncbi:hypothetical protein NTGHW29_300039 [Candidatus Nitrotoga sp. HW29]|nr:hypothetical protein NTGHW29_300039 [Candidatus Nitrotoga sp. HW29]